MSYMRYLEAKPIDFEDGHIFIASPSVADPASFAAAMVVCKKHKGKPIPVNYSFLTNFTQGGLVDAAAEALKQCDGCVHERGHETTRFPEGSEL
jgi:hypothetical protein